VDGAEQMSAVVDAIGKEDGQGMSLTVIAKSVSGAPPVAFFIGASFMTNGLAGIFQKMRERSAN